MTALLIRLSQRNCKSALQTEVRIRLGLLSGFTGIAVNLLLCFAKFITGYFTNSIAISVDAANNLADAGSSVINLLGFKFAGKPADEEHPFGHGRVEYVAALAVSFIILIMGIELAKSSVAKIFSPEDVVFSYFSAAVLIMTMLVKLWLAFFYRTIGRRIQSPQMIAVVTDSFSDIAATGAALLVLIFSKFSQVHIDGFIGLIVSVFVFSAGIRIVKNTIGPLLGEPPDEDFVKKVEERILSYDGVSGIHDLILHNYGPGRLLGSVHAEVPSDSNMMKSHDTIDLIEREIRQDFGIELVIHMDPIVVNDEHIDLLHAMVLDIVLEIDESLAIHDFRVVDGPTHTNLIFDLVVPYHYEITGNKLTEMIAKKLAGVNSRMFAVITVEQSYTKRTQQSR